MVTPPSPAAKAFRPWQAGIETALFRDAAGRQHVRLRRAGATIQLAVSGASVCDAPYLLTELVLPEHLARTRAASIHTLNQMMGCRPTVPSRQSSGSWRLQLVLQALDGDLAGASQRQIATLLFGAQRVARDWRDGHLRDCVRRAVGRGRRLMTGGYLELLRR
jgi:hypothetical protein